MKRAADYRVVLRWISLTMWVSQTHLAALGVNSLPALWRSPRGDWLVDTFIQRAYEEPLDRSRAQSHDPSHTH